jgi:peptide/nickel transport system permease protein
LIVFTLGIVVSWSIGTWLGRVTAWRRSDILGPSMSFLGVIAYTVFPPFLAFALGEWLHEPLRSLRSVVVGDHRGLLWREAPITEQRAMVDVVLIVAVVTIVTLVAARLLERRRIRVSGLAKAALIVGLVLAVLAVMDRRDYALDVIFQAAIPLLSFTVLTFGEFLLIAQAAMVASSGDDYVLTARAKGLSERRVRDRHVGRNANLVILTRLAVSLPYMLTGLVIIEAAVGWPGIGTFLFNAIGSQDMPVVMSGLAIIGGFTLITRLVIDFVVALGDPRITGIGPAEIRL